MTMIRHAAWSGKQARAILLLLALGACTGREPPQVDPNKFPADYKKDIVMTMPKVVADPTNIRGAFISEPTLMQFGNASRYAVCVRFNPRNANRQYTGSQDRIAIFYGGDMQQFVQATPEQCGKAAYQPFPELEKICLARRCD